MSSVEELREEYRRLAAIFGEFTHRLCLKTTGRCKEEFGCCKKEYCMIAEYHAKRWGALIAKTGNKKLPYMGEDGCVMPYHLRPLCTEHLCERCLQNKDDEIEYWLMVRKMDCLQARLRQAAKGGYDEGYSD